MTRSAPRVELRLARQQILTRDEGAPQLWSVLDECALRRVVGGPEVMRAQLAHLDTMAQRTNIEIQVPPTWPNCSPRSRPATWTADHQLTGQVSTWREDPAGTVEP